MRGAQSGGGEASKRAELASGRTVVECVSDSQLCQFPFPSTTFEAAWRLADFHLTDGHMRDDAYREAPDNTRKFIAKTYSKCILEAFSKVKGIAL